MKNEDNPLPLPTKPIEGAIFALPTGEKWLFKIDGGWHRVLKRTLGYREFLAFPQITNEVLKNEL